MSRIAATVVLVDGNNSVPLSDFGADSRFLLTFTGSNAGSIVVTAKVFGGDKFEDVTDGSIALNARKYVYIPDIPCQEFNVNYTGGGGNALSVKVFALPNR